MNLAVPDAPWSGLRITDDAGLDERIEIGTKAADQRPMCDAASFPLSIQFFRTPSQQTGTDP